MYDHPIYDKRRLRFRLPEDLKGILCQFPLNKEFIDWIVEQGFKIVYDFSWREGTGSVWWGLRQIMVSPHGGDTLVNLTLVHELIHIAAPGVDGRKYEEVIDEIAEDHVRDLEFMNYVKKKIPALVQK